jgi:hypothetical protein
MFDPNSSEKKDKTKVH